jgi:hypothetical protein
MISRDRKADYRTIYWKNLPLPKGYRVEKTADGLLITLRWYSRHLCFAYTAFGGMFLVAFGTPLVFMRDELMQSSPWVILCVSALAFAGLLMVYTDLAMLVDRTVIYISPELLSVHLYPLPVPEEVHLPSRKIDQLYVEQSVHRFRTGVMVDYRLMAILAGGEVVELLLGLDRSGAKFLEKQIEGWYGIANRLVPGEAL